MDEYDIVLIGVIGGITGLLDFVGGLSFPIGYGISVFYVGVAFYAAFAIWFGVKGLLGIYLGLQIGSLMIGALTVFGLVTSLANVVGALMPLLVFRRLSYDPELREARDYRGLVIAAVFYSVCSGVYFFSLQYLLDLIPIEAMGVALFGWVVSDTILIILLGGTLLKVGTPVVKKMPYASV